MTASVQGILLIKVKVSTEEAKERIFALSFGYGRHLLRDGVYEERFGLKTLLNNVNEEELRQAAFQDVSSTPKANVMQLQKAGNFSEFSLDVNKILIKGFVGRSAVFDDKVLTGKDSLSFFNQYKIDNIEDLLIKTFTHYNNDNYKKNYSWIDYISPITNKKMKEELDTELCNNLNRNNLETTWMAVPDTIDWENVKALRYLNQENDDVHIRTFLASISEGVAIDKNLLTKIEIECLDINDNVIKKWKSYKCFYCEVVKDNETFILTEGQWYKINKDYSAEVNEYFNTLVSESKSELMASKFSLPDSKNVSEGKYNETTSEGKNFLLFDKKIISHGGGHGKIEFCDLYNSAFKYIIHIKNFISSSGMSHLFAQGAVSGELCLDIQFRLKVNKIHNQTLNINDYRAGDYTIIFGIISTSPKGLSLPFFSKITLKDTVRRLKNLNYKNIFLIKIQRE